MRTISIVGRLLALFVTVSVVVASASEAAKTKPVPCPGGRYVLKGKFLVVGPGNPDVDAVILAGKNISTGSGCNLVVGKVHATKKLTKISAKFSSCRNVTGKATLKAKIFNNCQAMDGVFTARGSHIFKKQFSATLSVCGDGITDAGQGEECDGIDDTKCPGQCDVRGPCLCPSGTTPTTTIPGSKPDLTPTAIGLTNGTTVQVGQQVAVQWTVKNQGTGPASGNWYDYIYLSDDNLLTQQDHNLASQLHSTPLGVNSTYDGNAAVTIPQVPAGTYYLFVTTDSFSPGNISESNEDNNTKLVQITVTAPDLIPTAFTLPGGNSVSAGAQVAVQWTVKNQGTAPVTGNFYDYIYISDDNLLTQQDQNLLSLVHQSSVPAGGMYNGGGNITIPSKPPGTYYLYMITDGFPPGSVYEGGMEDNNTSAPIVLTIVAPDLTPTDFSLPGGTTVSAGAQVTVKWTVKNQGNGPAAPSWNDWVYISDDDSLTGQDQYLSYVTRSSALAVNATYNGSTTVTIPQKPPGTYYLFFATDGLTSPGNVYEGGADDNNFAGPIAIQIVAADLVPTDFSLPAGNTVQAGASVAVHWTVKNQGTGPAAPSWNDWVYISDDDTFTQQDTYLTYVTHSSTLAVNGTYNGSTNITIPNKVPGTYYLFFATDGLTSPGQVYEGGADDNNFAGPITITIQAPDLTPTDFHLPAGNAVQAGATVTAQWTVKNVGNGPAAPSWNDWVYLSDDNIFTQQDTYLTYVTHSSTLAANGTYTTSGNITIPNKPPGTYYLFFATDGLTSPGQVYEGGADDNNFAGPITITIQTPDLIPTAFAVAGNVTTLTRGTAYTVNYTVKNQGTGLAPFNFYDYVYLSTDNFGTSSDMVLSYKLHSSNVAAGASYSDAFSITIPNDANHPPGTYYLFFVTDNFGAGSVYEGGSDDNNVSAPLTITVN